MKLIFTFISLSFAVTSAPVFSQDPVQQQHQQQFQAEQNRLGHAQQQQDAVQEPYRFVPHIPYMHSAFAATPSGKEWGVGFSEHTDIEAKENAMRECQKVAKEEKCDFKLIGGSRPTAVVAQYLIDSDPDKVNYWFFESSAADPEDALRLAMKDCMSDRYTGWPHRCVQVATWTAPPMSRSR